MRLSELGELGLLAELERRGLIVGVQHDAAQLARRSRRHAGRARRGRPLPARLALLARPRLARRGRQSERPRGVGRGAGGAARDARRSRRDRGRTTSSSSTRGSPRPASPSSAATRPGPALVVSVTALGHSARVPGRAGAQPGDLLVVTGPLGAAGAAFREQAYVRPPLRLAEGRSLAAHAHALIDISDGLAVDAAHIARRSGVRCVIELDRVPLAAGATLDDLGFGEDFELSRPSSRRRGELARDRPRRGRRGRAPRWLRSTGELARLTSRFPAGEHLLVDSHEHAVHIASRASCAGNRSRRASGRARRAARSCRPAGRRACPPRSASAARARRSRARAGTGTSAPCRRCGSRAAE